MQKKLFLLFVPVLFLGCIEQKPVFEAKEVFVTDAIDGDTVRLFEGESVRLIGIDSTERGEECYKEAKEKLKSLAEGKALLLLRDIEEHDKYGRLLGYLFDGNVFINLEIVESGNAYAYRYPPNTLFALQFEEAQNRAEMLEKGCLWQKNPQN